MPPGTADQWHVHDRARQFFYVLEGNATMRTGNDELLLRTGTGVEVECGVAHQFANNSQASARILVVSCPSTRTDRREVEPGPDGSSVATS